jgi:hypothetical protein
VIRRIAGALMVAMTIPLQAQIGRRAPAYNTDPGYWVGLSYGYVSGTTIADSRTSAIWQFGYTSQLRASFEKTVSSGTTLGVSAGFSTAPLTYIPSAASLACPGTCQAKADISQYMAFFRGGGGPGFHLLYEIEAGMTEFSKFRTSDGDTALPPNGGKYDFSFGFGGGAGYGFSRTSEVFITQQWDLVLHPQGNVAGTNTNAPRLSTFRGGFRIGF